MSRRKRKPAGEPSRGSPKITQAQKDKFLEALSLYGNQTHAADVAGFTRNTAQVFRREDKEFAVKYEDALAKATDSLEMEAFKRGRDGYLRPVVSMGKVVMVGGTQELDPDTGRKRMVGGELLMERVVSDAILLRLLQAHHPKYAPVAQRVEDVPKELQSIAQDAEPDEPGPETVIE